jgi:hypothetical protein
VDNFFILWTTFLFLGFSTFFPQAVLDFSTAFHTLVVFHSTKLAVILFGLASPIYRRMFFTILSFGRGFALRAKKKQKNNNCLDRLTAKRRKIMPICCGALFSSAGVSLRSIIPAKQKQRRSNSPQFLGNQYFLCFFCSSLASSRFFYFCLLLLFSPARRMLAAYCRIGGYRPRSP